MTVKTEDVITDIRKSLGTGCNCFIIIILPYTQNIHIKLLKKGRGKASPKKPIRLVYRTTFKICYLINNYNTDIGNLTLSTYNLFGI